MKKFPIDKKTFEFELGFGCYCIMFTGGWYIENLDELNVNLVNLTTSETIALKSKTLFGLRKQDYVDRQQAVIAFEFDILKYSKLQLTISNPEELVMKRYHPFLFLHNLIFGRTIPVEDINVIIK